MKIHYLHILARLLRLRKAILRMTGWKGGERKDFVKMQSLPFLNEAELAS